MTRIRIGAAAMAVASVIAAGGALAAGAGAQARPTVNYGTKIIAAKTSKGTILETNEGYVLYLFTKGNKTSTCTGSCIQVWPAFENAHPTAGPGVSSKLLGTVTRGGSKQVTYDGHLLYFYDVPKAYDVPYIGVSQFGGAWDAVTTKGAAVK